MCQIQTCEPSGTTHASRNSPASMVKARDGHFTFRERTFGSKEFTQFAGEWGFGQSEGSVGTIKHLMRKAAEDGRDVHLDLLEYRNTPIPGLEYSPAQFLMSPKFLLFPKLAREVQKSVSARHQRQKKYHDHDTRTLPQLQVGDPVTTQQGRVWNPAITEKPTLETAPCQTTVTKSKESVLSMSQMPVNEGHLIGCEASQRGGMIMNIKMLTLSPTCWNKTCMNNCFRAACVRLFILL